MSTRTSSHLIPRSAAARLSVAALALVLAAAGCGGGSGKKAGTQPVVHSSRFGTGRFDGLPSYPRAKPSGPAFYKRGVAVRTFTVADITPKRLMGWYTGALRSDQWKMVTAPHAVAATYRGEWVRKGRHLLVTTIAAPTFNDQSAQVGNTVQYTLSLGDRGAAVQ